MPYLHAQLALVHFEPLINAHALFGLLALGAFVLFKLQRRSVSHLNKNRRRILGALRLMAFTLIAIALFNPVTVKHSWIDKPAKIAIMVDNSESMQFSDVKNGISRRQTVLELLNGGGMTTGMIEKIRRIAELDLYAFGSSAKRIFSTSELNFNAPQTNITSALAPLEKDSNATTSDYAAAILISDGCSNATKDASLLNNKLTALGIPVHTIGLGQVDTPDTSISNLAITRTTRKDTLVKLSLNLLAHNTISISQTILLKDITDAKNPIELARRNTKIESGGTKEILEFLPTETGFRFYSVTLTPTPKEPVTENNTRVFALFVVRRKIKVLYMEGSEYRRPMRTLWEHQYLENALTEDGDIEVKTLLRKNQDAARSAGVSLVGSKTDGYPTTRSELFKYDVIISSDIDIDFFSADQLANTVDFVSMHGGGFIMIGGWTAFGAGGYDESVMDKMLPVDMMGRKNEHLEENENFSVEITTDGMAHPIMQLADDKETNARIWELCPSFHGHNRVKRAKPAAVTLAEHDGSGGKGENLYGRDVVIAVQQYGNGRSMAFTTDTTAGWGTEFEESFGVDGDNRYYKMFWRNAIRWLAAYRLRAPHTRTEILLTETQHPHRTPLLVKVRVLSQDYIPAVGAEVVLHQTAPDSTTTEIKLTPDPTNTGIYQATITPQQKGIYILRAESEIENISAGMDSFAIDTSHSPLEFKNIQARSSLLQNISNRCGGSFTTPQEANKIFEQIVDLVSSVRLRIVRPLWDTAWLLAFIILLLSLEWAVRKNSGLA